MRSLRSARFALSAPRAATTTANVQRPRCYLPCWPACRAASSSAVTLPSYADNEDYGTPACHSRSKPHLVQGTFAPSLSSTANVDILPAPATTLDRRKEPPNPHFAECLALIEDSKRTSGKHTRGKRITLEQALDTIPTSAFKSSDGWPMSQLLELPASTAALGRLFPVIQRLFPAAMALNDNDDTTPRNVNRDLRAFSSFVAAATRTRALIFLAPVVDATQTLIESELFAELSAEEQEMEVVVRRYIKRHHRFMKALVNQDTEDWAKPSSRWASQHPWAVKDECGRMVQHLIRTMESLATASNEQGIHLGMSRTVLDSLFDPKLLIPATVEKLLNHCRTYRIPLKEEQWRDAAATLFHAGNPTRALACLARASVRNDHVIDAYRLMAAQGSSSFEEALHLLKPVLSSHEEGESLDDSVKRAWSLLSNQAAKDKSLLAEDLVTISEAIPQDLQCGYTLNPLLRGLVQRGEIAEARELWKSMQERHRLAPPEERHEHLDTVSLSAGAELLFTEAGIVAEKRKEQLKRGEVLQFDTLLRPFRLVDSLGSRIPSDKPSPTSYRSIFLDTRVIAVLLRLCLHAGSVSAAFRLWEAAPTRWRIQHDDTSLTALLDAARLCREHGFDEQIDTFKGSLRIMRSVIHVPLPPPPVDWKRAPIEAMLDPKGYNWHAENGVFVQPWHRARLIFRSILLDNWPELINIKAPPDHDANILTPYTDFLAPRDTPPQPFAPLPAHNSKNAHIVPGPASWAAYIALLEEHRGDFAPYQARSTEIGQALAWMRALGVKPTWRTMATALMYTRNLGQPFRRVRIKGKAQFMTEEDLMRHWLEEWVSNVPEDEEITNFAKAVEATRTESYLRKQKERWKTDRSPIR